MRNEAQPRHFAPDDAVTRLPGVGVKRAAALLKMDIETVLDVLRHFPMRYEDRRVPVQIQALADGESALCRVWVRRILSAPPYGRGRKGAPLPMKVVCEDVSGTLTLLFFNARWLSGAFAEGGEYWIYGTPHRDASGAVSMAHPDFERIAQVNDSEQASAGILPVYSLTAGISQKYLRGLARAAVSAASSVKETIPAALLAKRKLAPLSLALAAIHFPADEHALSSARYRLVYEEFFLLQARLLYTRAHTHVPEKGTQVCAADVLAVGAEHMFPYALTGAQRRALDAIRADMSSPLPMRRLLQGDVGSGKTAVAAAAAWLAAKSGFQTAIMAPTEILAAQHFKEFERFFEGTGIRVGLLSAGMPGAKKTDTKKALKSGELSIIIGTHALIEPDVLFDRLGLVVTDEQHRFGVRQRSLLGMKSEAPDTLVMTATPIPRTLALMLYADLDICALDEMPPGRKPVTTRFVNSSKRDAVYDFAEREMAAGRQIYVVAPSIGDEEEEDGSLYAQPAGLRSVVSLCDELTARFPHRRVKALHGQMKASEKEVIMQALVSGEIDLLVSTVIIEVGVNVPNATMMIIENSERFGLAQLHQLRGRVGRGAAKSCCALISDSESKLAVKRCQTLAETNDGFEIAELDLALRGPGDLFGVRQHGLPELKLADPARHLEILRMANEDAKMLLEIDPCLEKPEHAVLKSVVVPTHAGGA